CSALARSSDRPPQRSEAPRSRRHPQTGNPAFPSGAPPMTLPKVACVFHNKEPLGCTENQLLATLAQYANTHLAAGWGVGCELVPALTIPAGAWGLVFTDTADQAGALGYHDLTPAGLPLGHVFVQTSARNREPTSVVASHELAEMLL